MKRLLWFVVGVLLGGASVYASAGTVLWSSKGSLVVRGPDGVVRTITSTMPWGETGVQNLAGGAARVGVRVPATIGPGATVGVQLTRTATVQAVAKAAVPFVKRLGPAGLAVATLAPLLWDEEEERWEFPPEEVLTWYQSGNQTSNSCTLHKPGVIIRGTDGYEATGWPSTIACGTDFPPGWQGTNNCKVSTYPAFGPQVGTCTYGRVIRRTAVVCAPGFIPTMEGCTEPPEGEPASDLEIQNALEQHLADETKGGSQTTLMRPDVVPEFAETEASGPSIYTGPTVTTTTTTNTGPTTTNSTTTYNITYNNNVMNVSTTTTSTTINSDGTEETTTTTTTPTPVNPPLPGEEPDPEIPDTNPAPDVEQPVIEIPEQPLLCQVFPNISACQELGDSESDEELEQEEHVVTWLQEGGAVGLCPAPKTFVVFGSSYDISWAPICTMASMLRPLVIGLAWLSAGIFLFVVGRGSS